MTATAPDTTGHATVLSLSTLYLSSRVLHVVADLGIADALGDEPTTVEALAGATGTSPDALERLLSLLEGHGVFATDRTGRWSHTSASRALRSDDAMSMRSFARMVGCPGVWDSFTALEYTARTGEAGIHTLDPGGLWGYLQAHPDQAALFDEAMTAKSHGDLAAALGAYDFSRHRRIADVGGGRGHLIEAILNATHDTTGVLFDLPAVAGAVRPGPRLDVHAGDFFRDQLPACDAYLLMQILHDWDDTQALAILDAVRRAAPDGATVLLLEWVLPDSGEPHPAKTLDVMMLATTGGRERTVNGYRELLDRSGFDLVAVHPTPSPLRIVEGTARPASSG